MQLPIKKIRKLKKKNVYVLKNFFKAIPSFEISNLFDYLFESCLKIPKKPVWTFHPFFSILVLFLVVLRSAVWKVPTNSFHY